MITDVLNGNSSYMLIIDKVKKHEAKINVAFRLFAKVQGRIYGKILFIISIESLNICLDRIHLLQQYQLKNTSHAHLSFQTIQNFYFLIPNNLHPRIITKETFVQNANVAHTLKQTLSNLN